MKVDVGNNIILGDRIDYVAKELEDTRIMLDELADASTGFLRDGIHG